MAFQSAQLGPASYSLFISFLFGAFHDLNLLITFFSLSVVCLSDAWMSVSGDG